MIKEAYKMGLKGGESSVLPYKAQEPFSIHRNAILWFKAWICKCYMPKKCLGSLFRCAFPTSFPQNLIWKVWGEVPGDTDEVQTCTLMNQKEGKSGFQPGSWYSSRQMAGIELVSECRSKACLRKGQELRGEILDKCGLALWVGFKTFLLLEWEIS